VRRGQEKRHSHLSFDVIVRRVPADYSRTLAKFIAAHAGAGMVRSNSIRRLVVVLIGFFLGSLRPGNAVAVTVDVVAEYPGATAEKVERELTIPLELTFAGIPGLTSSRSESLFSGTHVRLEFESRVSYEQARQQVLSRLAMNAHLLPPGVAPSVRPQSAGHEILFYTLASPKDAHGQDVYLPTDLRALQDWAVGPSLFSVSGVAEVEASGGAVRRYEVSLDPDRLRRYGVTVRQVTSALAASNTTAGGRLDDSRIEMNVRSVGLFGGGADPVQSVLAMKDPGAAAALLRAAEQRRIREIRSVVVSTGNGPPLRLEDLVEGGRLAADENDRAQGVAVGHRPRRARAGLARSGDANVDDRVLGVVLLKPDADRTTTLNAIKAKIKELNDSPGRLLPGVRIEPFGERGDGAEEKSLILQAAFPANVSPARGAEMMRQAAVIAIGNPEVLAVLSQFGADQAGTDPAAGRLLALFHHRKAMRLGGREVTDDLREELATKLPGTDWDILPDGVDDFQAAFVATPGAGLLKIFGPDLDVLEQLARKAKATLEGLPGVASAHVRYVGEKSNLEFRVDPEKCARWNVTTANVNDVVALAVEGRRATRMIEGNKTFDVTLVWPEHLRRNEESLLDLPVDVLNAEPTPPSAPGPGGPPPSTLGLGNPLSPEPAKPTAGAPRLRLRELVWPLGADGAPDPNGQFNRSHPARIWREQGRRFIAVRFAIRGRSEAEVLAEAKKKLADLFQPPYRAEWLGAAERAETPRLRKSEQAHPPH
jgi:Cu/Ag efflux pump CusA